jgi:hypothetical protein
MRQKIFKGEPLIPVQPTDHVLILFPAHCPAPLGPEPSKYELSTLAMAAKYVERLQAETSLGSQLSLVQCVIDSMHGSLYLVLRFGGREQLLDVLTHCDQCRPIDPCNPRRAIALPFDPAEAPCVGLGSGEYFELPACSLCLDRLERSISGLVVSVCYCEDATNCQCIMSSTCVVCQAVVLNSTAVLDERLRCIDCAAQDDVWVCLCCGYVGCSRYQGQHAKQHFQSSLHDSSLSLVTQQVWDYQADRFVHRLIVAINCETGKSERVQFPEREVMLEPDSAAKGSSGEVVSKMLTDAKYDVKIEQCCAEYTQLLTSQLSLQREHYERQVASLHPSGTAESVSDPSAGLSALDIFHSLDAEVTAVSRAMRDWLTLERTVAALEQERVQRRTEEEGLQGQLAVLKQAYLQSTTTGDEDAANIDREIKDLQDTIAETRLNISVQKSISKSMKGESMTGSMMVVQNAPKRERRR